MKETTFNTLTEAYIRIQCCVYLLREMERTEEPEEEWLFSPYVQAETRLFLLDTLVEQLQRLHPVLLAVTVR